MFQKSNCSDRNNVSIYYQNVRGLRTKTADVFNSVSQFNYAIFALSETWLDPSINCNELFPNSFNVFRSDRKFSELNCTRGGGVLLAVTNQIISSIVDLNTPAFLNLTPQIDIIAVKITLKVSVFYLLNIYIPPNISDDSFEHLVEAIESLECLQNKNILIVGDFNISLYAEYLKNGRSNRRVAVLNGFCLTLGIQQCNFIRNSNNRILDLVLYSSNEFCNVERCEDCLVHEDDHHPALLISSLNFSHTSSQDKISNNYHNCYNFRKANFPLMYQMISSIDWTFLEVFLDIEQACTYFYGKLYNVFDACVPKYTNIRPRKYPPWFNAIIIREIKLKAKFFYQYKKFKNITAFNEFKRLRLKIKTDIDIAYKSYVQSIEDDIGNSPNKFWAFINSKRGLSGFSNRMVFDGNICDTPSDIVNAFSSFFSSSYLQASDISTINNLSSFSTIDIGAFDEKDVMKALKMLKPKMTTGPDHIPSFVVRDCATVLAAPLTTLINLCLKSGTIPALWKTSKVCPVYKKGDRGDIRNYRPISIICNFCKAFEILLYEIIYAQINKIISIHQHGFMKNRSTTTNLVQFTQTVSESLDEQIQTDVIYMDFSKAFDRLDHGLLLRKLSKIGFSSSLLQLFTSYLSERKQFVVCCGHQSVEYFATSGVPQGSNLGPLLFNIFINDILDVVSVDALLYADDLKIFNRIINPNDCLLLQYNISNIENWCEVNHLSLNPDKCVTVSFTLKADPIIYDYSINDIVIKRANTFKDLGVTFDSRLSFIPHIDEVVNSAFKSYGFIVRNSREFTNILTLKKLYYAFIRSKLEYASVIWGPRYQVHVDRLEAVQRRFLKFLSLKMDGVYPEIGTPHDNLLQKHSFKSLEIRRNCYLLVFLYKVIGSRVDCQFCLERLYFHIPRIASRLNQTFYLPTSRTNMLLNSPVYKMCHIYNLNCQLFDIFNVSENKIKSISLNYI